MKTPTADHFERQYQTHLKHLKLKGLQPKTIEAYARAIRRIGDYFDHQIDALTAAQLTDYFTDLVASHSWSSVQARPVPQILYGCLHVCKWYWISGMEVGLQSYIRPLLQDDKPAGPDGIRRKKPSSAIRPRRTGICQVFPSAV